MPARRPLNDANRGQGNGYRDLLPSRLAFALIRAWTGFAADRARRAADPESVAAATAEFVTASRTSLDWRATDSAGVRLAASDASAAEVENICRIASAASCWFIVSMRAQTVCADSSTASAFSPPMRASSRLSRVPGTALANARRLARWPITCVAAIAISPVFQANRLHAIHGFMNKVAAWVEFIAGIRSIRESQQE